MKDLIGKANMNKSSFPQKVRVQKLTYLTRIEWVQNSVATEFNGFFTNVDPVLAKQIPESDNTFES